MARAARRSVASNPSSPTHLSNQQSNTEHHRTSAYYHYYHQSTPDPLRLSGSLHTQQTVPTFDQLNKSISQPYSPNQFYNVNTNTTSTFNATAAAERERIRMEFYATYDVMTGVRIAATLGGFFGLMVFLVVYKSRDESEEDAMKALKDPKIAAVAAAVMQEEEDRELQEAMDATGMSIYPDEYMHLYRRPRLMSIGNMSAPPVLNRSYRFSSLGGGYSSLLETPARRFSYCGGRRKSTSESSRVLSAYPMGGSFGIDDYFMETDGDEADDEYDQLTTTADSEQPNHYLSVKSNGQESRRCSSITCCSTESSYLERRCSAITLGLTPLPPISSSNPSRRPSATTDMWDYYYPDIQVIAATPNVSPCPSEKSIIHDCDKSRIEKSTHATNEPHSSSDHYVTLDYSDNEPEIVDDENYEDDSSSTHPMYQSKQQYSHAKNRKLVRDASVDTHSMIQRAPLASLSSFKISSIDYQDSDLRSLGSDSVFAETYIDTDDEMDQFSTDSDENSNQMQLLQPHYYSTSRSRSKSAIQAHGDSSEILQLVPNANRTSTIDLQATEHVIDIESPPPQHTYQLHGNHYRIQSPKAIRKSSKTFRTKVTIERTSPNAIAQMHSFDSSITPENRKPMYPALTGAIKRPASYSGCTTSNSIISKVSSSSSNLIKDSEELYSNKQQQQSEQFVSCLSLNNQSSKQCVIIDSKPSSTSTLNPSVILELPIISTQDIKDTELKSPGDPSLPGPSRKWSKETLF